MGKGLIYQTSITPGIECVAVADLDVEKAAESVSYAGRPHRVVTSVSEQRKAVEQGEVAICSDGRLVAQCAYADVLIESTSAISEAAQFCLTALEHDMHLVLMNAEVDLIFGPYLMHRAHERGLTYTSCDGDQHGVIQRLVDEVELWGFDLVMAGNIKGYLDRRANPTSIIPEADKRNLDYRMCTAYTDGTKLCIEMALVANALDLSTAVPGMHGPRARHVSEVPELFDLDGMSFSHGAVVDYILGSEPGGGVFVVGHSDDPYQRAMLKYYKMGEGPYYVFYRPYHLCHVEAMQCVAEACLDGYSLLEPTYGFRTNVIAYAKRDLEAGETLDGIGGYTCYGLIENVEDGSGDGLPVCLAEDITLTRDVPEDERLTLDDVAFDPQRFDFKLYDAARAVKTAPPELAAVE